MNLSTSKLMLLLVIAVSICGYSYWQYIQASKKISLQEAFESVESSYSNQFCTAVFTNLNNCLTVPAESCPSIVHEAIAPCLENLRSSLPGKVSKDEIKEIHARVTACFEMNIREDIMQKYLIRSEECKQLMN